MAQYQILARKSLGPSGTGPKVQGVEKQRRNAALATPDAGRRRPPHEQRAAATLPACGGYSAWLQPNSQGIWLFKTESPHRGGRNKSNHEDGGTRRRHGAAQGAAADGSCGRGGGARIQLVVGPQPLWLRNRNFGLAQRIMVKRLATSPHDPLGITDSACKNQLIVVSIQYGPFNTYIPIRSTTIGKSRVARDPITMHTSWRSNSDIASVTRQTHLPKTHPVLWPEIITLLSPQIA
ncbi:hypothetical protein F511_09264 [Dorcoceras hygrometricum]|uniref:Uncharacterized protein n=1 Tax=Dorcoceras hygrometricum TaxID=472368 RepID=A0A2Z7CXN4_9LAMI|nr:hypothetical protein F511_09264 [Dorcoceras hygrometricum]